MESPSPVDGGLHHEHCIAADTYRNIQAYMGLVQMTHITTQETSAAPIKSESTSIAATTGAAQQAMVVMTFVPTPIPSASASTDVTPPPPPPVKPSARLPQRSSSLKSQSSSSKPSCLKESKSSSCPGLEFTHRMYHLDSDDIKLECDTHHLRKDSCKLPEYWDDSHESQDVSTWYFMTVTQTNPNTPIHPVNEFAHADKICLEKKHSQMDLFYKFGIYVKDIPGSILSFSLGKKSGGIHGDQVVSLKIPLSSEMAGLQSNNSQCMSLVLKAVNEQAHLSNHMRQEH